MNTIFTKSFGFRFLLAAQCTLVSIHLVGVYFGLVNPWKLGGYGMYTVPSVTPSLDVVSLEPEFDLQMLAPFDTTGYGARLWHFNFYCVPVGVKAFNALLTDNPGLIGVDAILTLKSSRFLEQPIRLVPFTIHELNVEWHDQRNYTATYHGGVCPYSYTINGYYER